MGIADISGLETLTQQADFEPFIRVASPAANRLCVGRIGRCSSTDSACNSRL
jgi:hypothetical protein